MQHWSADEREKKEREAEAEIEMEREREREKKDISYDKINACHINI